MNVDPYLAFRAVRKEIGGNRQWKLDKCFSQEITLNNLQVLYCLAGCHNNVFPSPPSLSLSFLPVVLVKTKRSVVNCFLTSDFPPMNETSSSGKT